MSAINPKFTASEIMEVACITCDASIGHRCCDGTTGTIMLGFHTKRLELREKLPALHPNAHELTVDEKAMIVHYAFVIMADSVSSKSQELFGMHFDAFHVQRFFCGKAIEELKKDGLLK
jgi:hypothetical protein